MLRGQCLQPIKNERNLEIEWLFGPQGSVVIEDRDPTFGFDEVRAARRRHAADEIYDALLRWTVVPGRKRSLPTGVLSGRQRCRTCGCCHHGCVSLL
jgi:hypothetical protein